MVYLNRIINKIKRLFAKRQYRLIENNLKQLSAEAERIKCLYALKGCD